MALRQTYMVQNHYLWTGRTGFMKHVCQLVIMGYTSGGDRKQETGVIMNGKGRR